MLRGSLIGLAVAAGAAYCPSRASAQATGPFTPVNQGVLDRPHPEYDPIPLHAGAFVIAPSLTAAIQQQSNVFAQETGAQSDTIWSLAPRVTVTSDWAQHKLALSAGLQDDLYSSHRDLDAVTWDVGLDGKLDVTRAENLSLKAGYARLTELPSSVNASPEITGIVPYSLAQVSASGAYVGSLVKLSVGVGALRWDYDPAKGSSAGAFDENQRDHTQLSATIRADYAIGGQTALFVEGSQDARRYEERPPVALVDRDSTGSSVLLGSTFRITHLIDGEAGVGYLRRDYDDPSTKTFSGPNGRVRLNWYATPLITTTVSAGRSVEDSGLPGIAAFSDTNFTARVDYELLRNLVLGGALQHDDARYLGLDRQDTRDSLGLHAAYTLNRATSLNLSYSYLKQESSGTQRGVRFDSSTIGLAVVLRP